MKSCKQKHSLENFVRELLIRTLSTNLLQIFCEIFLNSKVIIKSIIYPDNNFYGNSLSINGLQMSLAWGQVSALRPDSMQVFVFPWMRRVAGIFSPVIVVWPLFVMVGEPELKP